MNVQAVCSHDLKFTKLILLLGGRDLFMIGGYFETAGYVQNLKIMITMYYGILVGDSGYALKPYLLTPILNPQTPPERRYNYTQNILFPVEKSSFASTLLLQSQHLYDNVAK